jgi:large subunit ribosomal protein L6
MARVTETEVEILEGTDIEVQKSLVVVSGPKGTLKRDLWYPGIAISYDDKSIYIRTQIDKKVQDSVVQTFASHIINMMTGVKSGFEYQLKVVYSHFPIQVKIEGKSVSIGNFLGERKPRVARILGETHVKLHGDEIVVTGINKEDVGQTAANIEQATRIKGRDPRVFQDGIYIIEKAGRGG